LHYVNYQQQNTNHPAEIFSILMANQFAASEVTAMNNSSPFSSLQNYREFVKASGINQTNSSQPSTSNVQPTSQAVDSISKSMLRHCESSRIEYDPTWTCQPFVDDSFLYNQSDEGDIFSTMKNLFLGSPERDFDLRNPDALPSYPEESMIVFGDLRGHDRGKAKADISSEVAIQDDDSSSCSSVHSIPASPEHELSQSKAESPVKTKKARSSRSEPLDWEFVIKHVIVQTDSHPRVKQAIRNLFILYAHSPIFRDTLKRLHEIGGVKVLENTKIREADYDLHTRKICLNVLKLKTDSTMLAKLAFELFNASHAKQFLEIWKKAKDWGAYQYAREMEKLEYQSLQLFQKCYLEVSTFLRKRGLDAPRAWHFRRQYQVLGPLVPSYSSEAQCRRRQLMTLHTFSYMQDHRKMLKALKQGKLQANPSV
jgi:hypothetical protein